MDPSRPPGTNRFLQALPAEVYRRLRSALHPVALRHGSMIGHIGVPAGEVYFLDRGLISLVKVMKDGRTAEVGVVGTEGMVGITALMGMDEADTLEMIVQLDGSGYRLPVSQLRAEMGRSRHLQMLATRYLQFTMNRLTQSAACNVLHRLRQRCCRWLLMAQDNAQERTFGLTHEFLALMMGVHRPHLSVVLEGLQRDRILESRRGSITILDRVALEANACECYATIQRELNDVYR